MEAFGKLAAETFDRIVIREDTNRRGRRDGEIARLLRSAAIEGGLTEDRIDIVLEELDAVNATLELADRDDLVVLLVDKPAMVWAELERRSKARGQLV